MIVAQISDVHFTRVTFNPLGLLSKRLIGLANWFYHRKADFSEEALQALVPLFSSLNVDYLFLGGDFTTTSLASEFKAAKKWAESLQTPFFSVPGNHDLYTPLQKRYYRFFPNAKLKEEKVASQQLAHDWWLVMLDTAKPTFLSAQGYFSPAQEETLKKQLQKIPQQASIIILNHYPFFQNDLPSRSLIRGEALESIIAQDLRIKTYLHGHTHRHIIADLQEASLPIVLDGGCATHAKQGSWNLLTFEKDQLIIDVYRWLNHKWVVDRREKRSWKR